MNNVIRLLSADDYHTWIEIAGEVEPLFGSMMHVKEFQDGIMDCIKDNNAYGVEHEDGVLAGIIALDRKNNEISWLAVRKKYRGNRYGDKLIKKAIEELECSGDIFVQTFSVDVTEGIHARTMYERNGFLDLRNAGKNPAGIDTVIMVLRK